MYYKPGGSRNTTIMELGPQNHNGDGLSRPNSIIVVYMDPLGNSAAEGLRVGTWSRAVDLRRASLCNPNSAQEELPEGLP